MEYISFTLKSVTNTCESTFSFEELGDSNGSGRLGNLAAPSAQFQLILKRFISIWHYLQFSFALQVYSERLIL